MISYTFDKQNYAELAGLSTDTKPTGKGAVPNGSKFYEIDTDKTYRFNGETGEWFDKTARYPTKLEVASNKYKVTYSDNTANANATVVLDGETAKFTENGITVSCDAIHITVSVVGDAQTDSYSGEEQTASGYTATPDKDVYDVSTDMEYTKSGTPTAKRTNVGKTMMGLKASDFVNKNDQYIVVFDVTDGYEQITALSVSVAVVGAHETVTYDGSEHTVTGYTATPSSELYSTDNIAFSGTASASRTDVGTTDMGLAASQFSNTETSGNFDVTFSVTDGYITIEEA